MTLQQYLVKNNYRAVCCPTAPGKPGSVGVFVTDELQGFFLLESLDEAGIKPREPRMTSRHSSKICLSWPNEEWAE